MSWSPWICGPLHLPLVRRSGVRGRYPLQYPSLLVVDRDPGAGPVGMGHLQEFVCLHVGVAPSGTLKGPTTSN